MASTNISQSISLRVAAGSISAIMVGLGVNAIFRPQTALELLQFPKAATPADQKLVDSLMRIYGARNIAMSLGQGITAYFGHTKALAWILLGNSIVAIVDGFISKDQIGRGEWNHWGFIPVSVGLGSALLGVFDRS
jgi:Domain of unknown function (DUF4267)